MISTSKTQSQNISIFGTGTGRTGGTLVANIMCVHSRIMVFTERVHFFRFIYGRYDPLTPKNVERLLHHQRLRLDIRFGMKLEVEPILAAVLGKGDITYKTVYEAIMEWLLRTTGKAIWGEYSPFSWRSIPNFLGMYPNGKAFHVYRDLRAVLASWARMTFMPDHLYLNHIFNWIDSVNHLMRFRDAYPAERYLPIRLERVHAEPERTVHEICDFLEIPFETQLLEPEKWPALFDKRYVEANVSSYDAKRYYGFHTKLAENWRTALEPWQTALCEFLARDQLEGLGYECTGDYSAADLHRGLDIIRGQPFLLKNFQILMATREGTQELPNDPTDPRNWGTGMGGFDKFIDTPDYQRYLSELDATESAIAEKYA